MAEVRLGAGLDWENQVVLQIVQALLGLISPAINGVAFEFDDDAVTLHVAVSEDSDVVTQDVDDIVGALEGLLWPSTPTVSSRIYVGSPENNGGWEGRQHRLVYLEKL